MNKIVNILKEKKSLPLDKFIKIALYDKKYGYYMKTNPFGKRGDFITAPMVSPLFGEMISIWCVLFWEHLNKPKKILLVELGPGDGTLCKELLRNFKQFSEFNNCLEINLLEISKKLKKIQKLKIKDKKVKWIKKIRDVNYGPVIFLANEFFDSLPIKQIYKKNNFFFEKHIVMSKNSKKFKFTLKKVKKKLSQKINNLNLKNDGNLIEYPVDSIKYLLEITSKIKEFNGGILAFDYGYTDNKNRDTLQSVKKHKYSSLFTNIGSSDITSHVNFKLMSELLTKNKLDVNNIVNQNEFLQKLGIYQRSNILTEKMTFKEKTKIYYQLKKLMHLKEMGQLFKVFFAQKKGVNFSLGF